MVSPMYSLLPQGYLLPGSVVEIPTKNFLGLATHFAIVGYRLGPDGLPIVIANSAETGGPAEWTWTAFTENRPYKAIYYPSRLSPEAVLTNAYSMFGKRYDLVGWNCEHYANACHGLPAISRQVNAVVTVVALSGIALALAKAA
jgi:hypothetical protein